ncbi:MAG TPA: thiolase domain-containing protein [Anaerolineae bacterium]|nr:thiolase domain-containing protein [Anaerolineae bacterium]
MTNVSIIGAGQVQVGEHWQTSIRHLSWYAIERALDDAKTTDIDAIFVGNMLAGHLSNQQHLGALVADFSGMRGREAVTVEAAEASGGAALRQATLAVASGMVETALVVGVEKMTDQTGKPINSSLMTALDAEYESFHGVTMAASAAMLMQRYMYENGLEAQHFANFSVNAHANGATNPLAMFRNRLRAERFTQGPMVAAPITLFDAAPSGDGAAALIITRTERARDMVPQPIQIAGSAIATDTLALHDREDILWFRAAEQSAQRAMAMAGVTVKDIDFCELHDSFTVVSALSLEACGFATKGTGWKLAQEEAIMRGGSVPISTMGGLKARGNPAGATGVYQVAEAVQQLRGQAGDNQIEGATVALTQNLGGVGATAVTHILKKDA